MFNNPLTGASSYPLMFERRILVTGGSGFLGSHLCDRLVARGEVVVVEERLGVTMTEIIKDGDAA